MRRCSIESNSCGMIALQRGALTLFATKGKFISPRGACFSTINFSFPKECDLSLEPNFKPQKADYS